MDMSREKVRTPKVRATEKESGPDSDPGRVEGISGASGRAGNIGQRTDRSDWIRVCKVSQSVDGKIIEESIAAAKARLAEAEDCLDWYNRDKQRQLQNIERLEKIKAENDRAIAELERLERETATGAIDMDEDLTGGGEETTPQS